MIQWESKETRPMRVMLMVSTSIDTRPATVADLRAALEALPLEQREDWCVNCKHKDAPAQTRRIGE